MSASANDQLLAAVRGREKGEPFNYGILTADRYVRTLQDVIGTDRCYRFLSRDRHSFDDLVRKAAGTLVYSNEEMALEEEAHGEGCHHCGKCTCKSEGGEVSRLELPKNTLMVFRHVLTSSRKDRDGDVLHSEGATVDPKMLLLWQHVHTQPIGKMIRVVEQNSKKLVIVSCIVDMNELSHDCAVMVDSKMGRFSHGFRATKFRESKERQDGRESGGFDISEFEIMEESLVSVPANTDAETEEVILSLVEGGKLTSPMMKEVGRGIRAHRSVQVAGVELKWRERNGEVERELVCATFDQLKAAADAGLIGDKKDENKSSGGGEAGGKRAGAVQTGAPEEADEDDPNKAKAPRDEEVECPECGKKVVPDDDGRCPECGEEMEKGYDPAGAKPYPNEHAARQTDPGRYEKVRRQNDKFGRGIHAVWGVDKEGKTELQSVRFDAGRFTAEEARKWLEEHDMKTGVEEASGKEKGAVTDTLIRRNEMLKFSMAGYKSGRILSKANEGLIRKAKDHVDDVAGAKEFQPRQHGAQLREASGHLDVVLKTVSEGELSEEGGPAAYTVAKCAAHFLAHADSTQRKGLLATLNSMQDVEHCDRVVRQYRELIGAKREEEKPRDEEKPGKEPPKTPEGDGPQPFEDGDLHKAWHKGCRFVTVKEAREFLTKCGLKCSELKAAGCGVSVEGSHKAVATALVKAGMQHRYFTEEDDKRVDAFQSGSEKAGVQHIKATSVFATGGKQCQVHLSVPEKTKPEEK